MQTLWRPGPHVVRLHAQEQRNGVGVGPADSAGGPGGQAGASRLLFAGLAGRGGRQAPGARRPGSATERHVRRPDRAGGQQLRAGPGEVQYLNGPALWRAGPVLCAHVPILDPGRQRVCGARAVVFPGRARSARLDLR